MQGYLCTVTKVHLSQMRRIYASLVLIALILALHNHLWAQVRHVHVQGTVMDTVAKRPLESAHVIIQDLGIGTLSQRNGAFSFPAIPPGEHTLVVTYVGYATHQSTFTVRRDTLIWIQLFPSSLALKEVVVSASSSQRSGNVLRVGEEALAHIQPTSIADVLQFVPGQLATDGRLHNAQQISLRQAGADVNTALGTAIMVDGVPLSNNANLLGLAGDQKVRERQIINHGIDLRMLSTDHYQQVEVLRGIASVRYGDLNSGAIELKAKRGAMPLQVRAKADPVTKIAYAGKGFHLPKGTLHVGMDFAYSTPDERLVLESYKRYSGQASYSMGIPLKSKTLDIDLRGSFIGTLESDKHDPDLTKRQDSYHVSYSRYQLSLESRLALNLPWIQSLRFNTSFSYTDDILRRAKTVVLHGATPIPIGKSEGEYEGAYLPHEYLSEYSLISRPVHSFSRLELLSLFSSWKLNHSISLGMEFQYEKNLGSGANYDLLYPPTPGSPLSSRPRPYNEIPGVAPIAAYLEDKIRLEKIWGDLELSAGMRLSQQLLINKEYKELRRPSLEPRVNAYYAFESFRMGQFNSTVALRAGWGRQQKWPTLDMLSPATVYYDFVSLNYYSQTPENRLLWVTTFIEDARNFDIKPASVEKVELGLEWQIGRMRAEIITFHEEMRSGFTYKSHYMNFIYSDYTASVQGYSGGKPDINTLTPTTVMQLLTLPRPSNGLKTMKRGVEYRLSIPKIGAIQTSFELQGAYFKTVYDVSEPVEYRPVHIYKGKPYPYVGIYAWSDGRIRSQANTNLWAHTHISSLRLIFSTMVQCVWFQESGSVPFDGMPTFYRDLDGNIKPYTLDLAQDPELGFLAREFQEEYFAPSRIPINLTVNLKVTKEIGKHTRLSFFVNRLWGYLPNYRGSYNRLIHRTYAPFFGAELKLSI